MFLIFSTLLITSCNTSKKINTKPKLNTKPNTEYKKSTKSFYGKLTKKKYKEIRRNIETEFGINIPQEKAILINYKQNASNCIMMGRNKTNVLLVINNSIRISNRISSKNNTVDLFIYSKDAFHKDLFAIHNFKQDSGYFFDNIFTIHENCGAFFILKPNGKFMKYYGEDYYSEVRRFLEK